MTLIVFAVFDEGKLHFSGLHQDILIYRENENRVELIKTDGFWIGILYDIFDMLKDNSLILNINDVMLLYTDGITEAWKKGSNVDKRRPQEDMFGNTYEHLNVVDCWFEEEKCLEITGTPTWFIKGDYYAGKKEIEELKQLTGC